MEETEKKRKFIIDFVYLLIILGVCYFGFTKLYPIVSPLLVAWIIVAILHRLIGHLSIKLKVNRKIIAVIILVLTYVVAILILFFIGTKLFGAIKDIFVNFPIIYTQDIEPYLVNIFNNIQKDLADLDPGLVATVGEFSSSLLSTLAGGVSSVSVWVVGLVSNFAKSLPGTFIRVLVSIIASIFMAIEYQEINEFISRQFSKKVRVIALDIKTYIINILWGYVKSYSIILLVTFTELAIGFTIFGMGNSILIALIIAVFDILPILGTGTVMIPWIIVTLIQQNYVFAIQLSVIYVIVTIVRNIIEPKIVGAQVGLPPLIILISVFVGAQLFGVLGLFGLPMLLSLLNYLNKKGTIHLYKQ